ncbi:MULTISPECIES: TcfC E-set like domain-containing protein [Cysteiniphilum]|uniref:TcfC E-set like domain-containing protein n=1 Tax=Cysteiniphilum TaxID=2056696 RepID=UPI00177B6606|nr:MULTISPECIES: TcfC E-set like domain-containing protein [Cysteiniphilum]
MIYLKFICLGGVLSFCLLAKAHANKHIPKEFIDFASQQGVDVNVQVSGVQLGYHTAYMQDSKLEGIDLNEIFSSVKLKDTAKAVILDQWRSGIPFEDAIYCSTEYEAQGICKAGSILARSHFSTKTSQLDITINKSAVSYQNHQDQGYLNLHENTRYGSIFNYDLYFDVSNETSSYNLNLENISSVNNTSIHSGIIASGNENSSSETLTQLYVQQEFQDNLLIAGFMGSYEAPFNAVTQMDYIPSVDSLLIGLSSSNNMKKNKNASSQVPILIYAQSNTKVKIYKENNLLSVQSFAAGTHEVDTSSFPYGIYSVRVEIYQGNTLIETRISTVVKPTSAADFGDRSSHYRLWLGMAKETNYQEQFFPDRFNKVYLGGAYAFMPLTNTVTNLSAYVLGSTVTGEAGVDYLFSESLSFNASGAIDNYHGYGFNINAQMQPFSLLSMSLWYQNEDNQRNNYQNEQVFSAFAKDYNSIGISTSIHLNDIGLGSLSGSYMYNLKTNGFQSNVSHYKTWVSARDYQIYSTINYGYSKYTGGQYKDFSIMLNFSYFFDNGSSINSSLGHQSYNNTNSGTLGYSPNFDSNYIDDVSLEIDYGDVSESQGISVNLGSDNISGFIDAAHQSTNGESTSSIYGSLSGSFALVDFIPSFSADQYNQAGVMIDMDMPEDASVDAEIDGRRYSLSAGQNLIMLPAYQEYTLQLLEDRNDRSNLQYSEKEKSFTLMPGNIVQIDESAIATIHVLGRALVDGKPKKNVMVKNHINQTVTDEKGYFMVYIDKRNPTLQINGSCKYEFQDPQVLQSGQWIGVIEC